MMGSSGQVATVMHSMHSNSPERHSSTHKHVAHIVLLTMSRVSDGAFNECRAPSTIIECVDNEIDNGDESVTSSQIPEQRLNELRTERAGHGGLQSNVAHIGAAVE